MLGASFASCEKVSDFDFGRRSAGRQVGFVQDENTSIVVTTEQPSVAVLAVVNLALVIGHLGLRLNQPAATRLRSLPPVSTTLLDPYSGCYSYFDALTILRSKWPVS